MAPTVLIGGARSAKSSLAVEWGRRSGEPVVYVATAPRPEDAGAVQKDQWIIISTGDPDGGAVAPANPASPNAPRGDAALPGADAAVRVLFNQNDATGRRQGVLTDSPRVSPPRGGPRSMLQNQDGSTTVNVWAWALRPIIQGERGGDQNSQWRVRPTGARVITLGGAQ